MKKTRQQRMVLLDAHALLHRAYHALPEFTNSQGEPTGGLYGFLSMIFKIATDFSPDYIVACYDLPQKTFRHEAYDGYKGKRAKTDSALVSQIEHSRTLCQVLGIPIYDVPGFEADDMLGTIVEQTKQNPDLQIVIATGDMDSLQLVDDDRVVVFTLKKGINDTVIYNEQAVHDRFGFDPKLLPDFKGLRGDPSDNIIGVPGIGEKTATDIILAFQTIEHLYEQLHADRNNLTEKGIKERIINLLTEHEESALFSKTLATIRRDAPIRFNLPDNLWRDSCDYTETEKLLRRFEFKSLITRLDTLLDRTADVSQDADQVSVLEATPVSREAKIALWLLDSEKTNPDDDDVFAFTRTKNPDEALQKLEQKIQDNHLQFIFETIEKPLIPILESMQHHGVMIDRDFLKNYSQELHVLLESSAKKIYDYVGHEFNINSPKQLGEVLFGEMNIHADLKGFKIKKTATGSYSTKESDLEKLIDAHPIIAEIFEYRELQKLLSTYIDNLPEMVGDDGRLHPQLIQTGAATGRFASQHPNIQNIPIRTEQGKKIRNAFTAPQGFSILTADYSQIELRIAAMLSQDSILVETFLQDKDVHTSVAAKVFDVPEDQVTSDMRRKAKVINFGILYGMGVTALQKNLMTTRVEAQKFYDAYFEELSGLAHFINETIDQASKNGFTKTLFGRRRMFPALRSKIPFVKAMAERAASNAPIQGTSADIIKLAMIDIDRVIKQLGLQDSIIMTMQIHDELVFEVSHDVLDQAKKLITETMEQVLVRYQDATVPPFDKGPLIPLRVSVSHGKTWGDAKD
jgi:DNA polymerase-1